MADVTESLGQNKLHAGPGVEAPNEPTPTVISEVHQGAHPLDLYCFPQVPGPSIQETLTLKKSSIYLHVYVFCLHVCLSVYHVHAGCPGRLEEVVGSMELETQMVVRVGN